MVEGEWNLSAERLETGGGKAPACHGDGHSTTCLQERSVGDSVMEK
jgi:hypothetical protein